MLLSSGRRNYLETFIYKVFICALLFDYDQILVTCTEENFQKAIYKSHVLIPEYNMEIWTLKTKIII
jgi:hypothetical protein